MQRTFSFEFFPPKTPEGADKLRFIVEMQDPAVRLQRIRDLLQSLQ